MTKAPISNAARIVGERVREFRSQAGLNQEQLAEAVGVHWTFVSQVERGLRNVTLTNLLRFAEGLGVNPAELVDGLRPPGRDD